jgi:LPXTG-motif cell wall-anchored protein
MGGCTANCTAPSGAFFCDGQFVDVTDISSCTFTLNVSATIGSSGSSSCAAAPLTGSPYEAPAALGMLASLGLFVARRRRRG